MSCKRLFSLLILVFTLSGIAVPAFAQHEDGHHHDAASHQAAEPKKFNASEVIFGHIADAHEWHFFTAGHTHVSLPLPVILYSPQRGLSVFSSSAFGHAGHRHAHEGYRLVDEGFRSELTAMGVDADVVKAFKNDKIVPVTPDGIVDGNAKVYDFSITKNVLSMLISVVLLLVIMTNVAKKYKAKGSMTAPSGFQNALEPVITFVRDEVAKPNLGHKYMRFMPLLLTLFFFIWVNNLLGLIPGGANFTGNIAVTACLALVTFIVMVASGNKHFWGHLLNPPGVPFGVKILLVLIEIISLFIKPIALMIRLFANIMAGHIIILSIVSMIFIFGSLSAVAGWGFAPVSLAFTIFMFFLELLVAAIQAFIFTNLTAVFIGQAVEEGHEHDHAHEEYHAHNPETGQEYNVSKQEVIA